MQIKEIRALYTKNWIRVYQAYSSEIAEEAIRLKTFGSKFKRERMTWIKPSFLWMMYRCGWGSKQNQERILAIDIKRPAFDYLVKNAVLSRYEKESYNTYEEWRAKICDSEIRCQWDPERDIYGNPLEHRTIQLGLKGKEVQKYVDEWIINITDITDFVKDIKMRIDTGENIMPLLPVEKIYIIGDREAN